MIKESQLKHLQIRRVSGNENVYNCLFCNDSTGHMYVNLYKGVYNCFKCGTSGRVVKDDHSSEVDVKKYSSHAELIFYDDPISTKKVIHKSLPRNGMILENTPEQSYLYSRGLKDKEIRENGIKACLDSSGPYSRGILFPDPRVENIYFVVRKLDTKFGPKYINAPWPKEGFLYRPHSSYSGNSAIYCVICEGVFDAIKIARVTPAIALLGKTATLQQLENLAKNYKTFEFAIMLDPDAFYHALKLKLALREFTSNPIKIITGMTKDPGDSTKEEIKEALK